MTLESIGISANWFRADTLGASYLLKAQCSIWISRIFVRVMEKSKSLVGVSDFGISCCLGYLKYIVVVDSGRHNDQTKLVSYGGILFLSFMLYDLEVLRDKR